MDLELHKCIWNIERANIDGHTRATQIPSVPIVQFVFWIVNQNGSHTWLFEQFKVQKSERYFFSTQNIIATQTTRTAFIRKCLATRSMPLPSHMQCILRDIEVFLFSFLRLFLLLIQLLFRGFCLVYGTMYVCAVCTVLLCIYVDGFDEICQHFLCHWSMWLCQLDGFFLSAFDVCRSFYSPIELWIVAWFLFWFLCVRVFCSFFVVFHQFELSYSRMQFNVLFPFLPLSTFNV